MIAPEFWFDEEIGELDSDTQLTYIGTWNFADDYGVIEYAPKKIKVQIFPYKDVNVAKCLEALIKINKLIVFEAEGKKWLHIKNFLKNQTVDKPSKNRNPTPPVPEQYPTTPRPVLDEVSKGSEENGNEVSEGKGSEEGKPNSPSPNGSGAKKDFSFLKKYAKPLGVLLAILFLTVQAHAATVEVTYTIQTKTVSRQKISPKPPNKPSHAKALDVPKVAGASSQLSQVDPVSHSSNSKSEDEIINSKRYPDIIRQIYQGESTSGRNDECRRRGIGFNGFGFGESMTRLRTIGPMCYPTFDAVVTAVDDWIGEKIALGYSKNVINCLYVRGYAVENCSTAYKLQ